MPQAHSDDTILLLERTLPQHLGSRLRGVLAAAALDRHHVELLRRHVGDAVEELVAVLDELDAPDEDLEDEPETLPASIAHCKLDHVYDPTSADYEPNGAEEPSLGSLVGRLDQTKWSGGGDNDAEQEHDGRETSLGSLT